MNRGTKAGSQGGGKLTDPRVAAIWRALESVADPEIPVLNVVEMGMIADVRAEQDRVTIDMTPTFVGCPALETMRRDMHKAVSRLGVGDVTVNVVFDPPWTTERMSEEARQKLEAFGLAPPKVGGTEGQGDVGTKGSAAGAPRMVEPLERIACPFCRSTNTVLESMFGPTLCRSIHYCYSCLQSFEHFKTV